MMCGITRLVCPVLCVQECINLIKELDAPVEYIVLPTFAYEHKVFVGPFSRRFPSAKVSLPCCFACKVCSNPKPQN